MIHKQRSAIPGHVQVIFELPASVWADKIFLTGDFNQWSPCNIPLHQKHDGVWRVSLDLPLGQRYEFRYVIDGHWSSEFHADGHIATPSGGQNSFVDTILPQEPTVMHRSHNVVPATHSQPPSPKAVRHRSLPVSTLLRSPGGERVPLIPTESSA